MHNELGLYTGKALGGKGNGFFIAVKGVKRSVFV